MSFIQELVNSALEDDYLQKLIEKAEHIYGLNFLKKSIDNLLSEKEYLDIMRFADILSRDINYEGRNIAYKIISILYPFYKDDEYYKFICNSVMTKLGNFPSLGLIMEKDDAGRYDTPELLLDKQLKEVYQKVPGTEKIFTDAQYRLFEAIKDSNHFSFSGPTSFGKSFIMDAFINYIIDERHGVDNIIVLVPTRALINQVSKRLKVEIKHENYRVMTHPIVPAMYRKDNAKYVFVFTPERMIAYLSEKNNPLISYLFIDEAQKIIAKKDSRAPLYYQAISMAERKSIKLFFASPNIPNSDIFLKLFDKSTDECMVIKEAPVSQNRFFIDFVERKEKMFTESGKDDIFEPFGNYNNLNELLLYIGRDKKNIIYCNSVEDTINFALSFSKVLEEKKDLRIDEVIKLIQEYLHKDYYLIDCLKKGIAFHFGKLPQRIREKIEELYEQKAIDYMFCTSTLLEGVNLPAQNIFILNNTIGLRKFTDVDFWNLAGRAGRLSKELSGNIICVRLDSNKWNVKESDMDMIRKKVIKHVSPTILKGEDNFYKNVENSLLGKPFTKKSVTKDEAETWNHYANIIYYQEVAKADSLLKSNFMKKNHKTAKKVLENIEKNNVVPENILEQSTSIKPMYQNAIWNGLNNVDKAFPEEITPNACYGVLVNMYKNYKWKIEESKGRNPLVRDPEQLKYYAVLMYTWMSSKPLNMIIGNMINYYRKKGRIWHRNEYVLFVYTNKEHINWVINDLIADIDNALRFKIKNYFSNYYLLVAEKNGVEVAGADWSEYLEYGTTDKIIIDLQNVGFPRHIAMLIKEKYEEVLVYDENELLEVQIEKLLGLLFENNHKQEHDEILDILGIVS
jgi:replicative superfamily II helicase